MYNCNGIDNSVVVYNAVEVLVSELLDDEEFDFDLPVSPVDSDQ